MEKALARADSHAAGGTEKLPSGQSYPVAVDEGTSSAPEKANSPSPPNSASATTGSSTTPTSIGNVSVAACEKGPGPESPERFTPSSQAAEERTWYTSYQYPTDNQTPRSSAALKLLVSNNVAGSIIGRAGQTISELQTESNTRIKLSQSGDYYPGTQDRVCLVQGEPEAMKTAFRLVFERLYMLQETQHVPAWQQHHTGSIPVFDFVTRLLVPVSSCGMIIGKAGSNIKFLEDTSGVTSIRLSPKDDGAMVSTMERIVTLSGATMESCLECVYLLLDMMSANPDISRYSNVTTSYANCIVPFGSPTAASPSQSQVLLHALPTHHSTPDQHRQYWEGTLGPPTPGGSPGLTRRFASSPDLPGSFSLQPRHSPERPYGDHVFSPPFFPLQMPQHGTQHSLFLTPRQTSFEAPLVENERLGLGTPPQPSVSPHLSVSHSASAPNLLAMQLGQSLHISSSPQASHHEYRNPAIVPQAPIMTSPGCFSAQVLIPDSMIGSILGRRGRTLSELQMLSGTRIRISQRGEYMPGTRSRIVNIQGSNAQSVWQAQYMMSQRMMLPPTAEYYVAADRAQSFDETQQQTTEDRRSS